jgi:hypothetical protein
VHFRVLQLEVQPCPLHAVAGRLLHCLPLPLQALQAVRGDILRIAWSDGVAADGPTKIREGRGEPSTLAGNSQAASRNVSPGVAHKGGRLGKREVSNEEPLTAGAGSRPDCARKGQSARGRPPMPSPKGTAGKRRSRSAVTTPINSPRLRKSRTNAGASLDLPVPGGPVTPIRCARRSRG